MLNLPKELLSKDSRLTGDPILDEALAVMAYSKQSHTPKYWVDRLRLLLRGLPPILAEQLTFKGVLTKTENTTLCLLSFVSYKLSGPHSAPALKDHVRQVLFQSFALTPVRWR